MSNTNGDLAAVKIEKKLHADPTKDFFVNMITRDISLKGCIFDLLDNSIDGARRELGEAAQGSLAAYFIRLQIDRERFSVADNCGGIRLSDAIDYAFHFGRRVDSPADVKGGIGLYGIGMKRAIFKIGSYTEIVSEAEDACFRVTVDVNEWKKNEKNWDFEYEDAQASGVRGTRIAITSLHPGIADSLGDPAFRNTLIREIAQDYAFFVERGFRIYVDETLVPSYHYELRSSSELAPAVESYEDDGVKVRLAVGFIDDLDDDVPGELRPKDVQRYGWFVICNNRVVLAADKSNRTVWGNDSYQVWHPQYNGIAGFAFFEARDQRKLPWTTTKRDLDESTPLYRRALVRMKRITDQFIEYTNRRKSDLNVAKDIERAAQQVDVSTLNTPQSARLPMLSDPPKKQRDLVSISYRKPRTEVDRIRNHIGRPSMSLRDVGSHTFEYFSKAELGE